MGEAHIEGVDNVEDALREGGRGREGTYLVADNEEGLAVSLHFDDDRLQPGDHVQVGLSSEGGRERGEGDQ